MPSLSNPRHETYAQNLANGMRQLDAYIAAGFSGSASSASQLSNEPHVRDRVIELQAEKADQLRQIGEEDGDLSGVITLEWLVKQTQINMRKAQAAGQINAANKAIELLIELSGLGKKSKDIGDLPSTPQTQEQQKDMSEILNRIKTLGDNLEDVPE